MQRRFITIRSNDFNEGIDLELPGNKPIVQIMPDLLKVLNWPTTADNKELLYTLRLEDQELDLNQSFDQIGIENFQTIWVNPPRLTGKTSDDLSDESAHLSDEIKLPFWQKIQISEPCLISQKGLVFSLNQSTTIIGRNDTGIKVDIDLTELEENQFISSRKHAEIKKTGNGYFLTPYKTTNGTILNGQKLLAGESVALSDNSRIQFGFRGVQLIFRIPV